MIRSSSVATTRSESLFEREAFSYTCWIIGFPRMSRSGFPGRRVDA